jgi:class 3 adenylate cyclase
LLVSSRAKFSETGGRVPTAAEIGDRVLSNIWNANELRVVKLAMSSGDVVKGLSVGDEVYLFAFRAIEGYGEQPWIVGTYFDGSRTRTQIRRLVFIALAGLVILVLVAVLALVIGRGASRPAARLARAAQLVREGELERVVELPPSALRELNEASMSFNSMVEGLRERDVIRDLFGKFVPERVAAEMLHSPEGLAPQACQATILFVDLADFTALAEEVGPVAIVNLLNAYFSELVTIIEAHDGIVTQFQGDAILAVFNVPRPVPEHARRAVDAARAIQSLVAERTFVGHRLHCRIGIATGEIVAGNVGARGRMNYTVHGDAVNLAARLEQLNKEYGSNILIAESTVKEIDSSGFRKLGAVDVRGRSARVTLYTLSDPGDSGPAT